MKNEYQLSVPDLISYIDKTDVLPIAQQAKLLGIARSDYYYQPAPIDPINITVMDKIDEIYTKRPYYGSRRMAKEVSNNMGYAINRKRIQRLMQLMGIEAIYPKPNLSSNPKEHIVYPYLLRNVPITHINQVWGTDITYIRMAKGFLYLTAFMDWYSRYVLAWRLSTTLTADFVVAAAKEALTIGIPEITNSDQGVQFTSRDYLTAWDLDKTKISMDGRGRAMDNIFTERLWRSVKYEEVYLKNYQTVYEATEGIGNYLYDYNHGRLHQSLGYQTPAEIYFKN